MVKVKFCGLTCLEDALAAVHCGADMLGFNFYPPSPRSISPQACAEMVSDLREALEQTGQRVICVGVFVNMPVTQVQDVLGTCHLDLAQLSGDEPPADLAALGEPAFKALRARPGEDLLALSQPYLLRRSAPTCLVDASVPGQFGGSGQLADWEQASLLAREQPLLLAGGLHPGNVAHAIQAVHPWGVDVASGIESAPGIKDKNKMFAFVSAVHQTMLQEKTP